MLLCTDTQLLLLKIDAIESSVRGFCSKNEVELNKAKKEDRNVNKELSVLSRERQLLLGILG